MKKFLPKLPPIALYLTSIVFFVLGMIHPIMSTTMFLLSKKEIYLKDSVQFFFDEGELFIGVLILVFTFIFPILKYLYLGSKLIGFQFKGSKMSEVIIDIINKWAMLDVFVVALIIINMKMNSAIIKSTLKSGATYFAISILLLMVCSLWIKYSEKWNKN
jgi:paraquat-inducible protein A